MALGQPLQLCIYGRLEETVRFLLPYSTGRNQQGVSLKEREALGSHMSASVLDLDFLLSRAVIKQVLFFPSRPLRVFCFTSRNRRRQMLWRWRTKSLNRTWCSVVKPRSTAGRGPQAFNPATLKAETGGSLRSKSPWSTKEVLGQLDLYGETLPV